MFARKGPLASRYSAAVVLVLSALTPYLVLTTALQPLQELIAKDTGLTMRALGLTTGMANAAYAVGAVLAVQFAARGRPRRLLLAYGALFITSSVLTAWAPTAGLFVAGHVVQGLATGLLLIGAVPPLVIAWPQEKLPTTAVVMNLGIFGAVALGPVVGGAFGGAETWRPLFWIVAVIGAVSLLFSVLTFEDTEAQDPSAPIDLLALGLATGGCGATFFAVSELVGRRATEPIVLLPLIAGITMLVALLVHQYSAEDPLIPIHKLAHTIPIAAIVIAMAAGAASVALVQLTQTALMMKGVTPNHAGNLFWPEIGMALVASILFGRLFFTRWTPALAWGGLLVLAGGAVVLVSVTTGGDAVVLIGTGLLGFGVGASVSPALFLSAFSLPSTQLPRVFAMIELLRGVAAFLIGPVLLQIAMNSGATPAAGLRTATWIAFAVALVGAAVSLAIFLAGKARLQRPDIGAWLKGETAALRSPALAAGLRGVADDDESANADERPPAAAPVTQ